MQEDRERWARGIWEQQISRAEDEDEILTKDIGIFLSSILEKEELKNFYSNLFLSAPSHISCNIECYSALNEITRELLKVGGSLFYFTLSRHH